MAYTVEFSPGARRAYHKLDASIQRRIGVAVDRLSARPRPPGVKKLSGESALWRIRVGDYRVLYQIQDAILLVLVVDVAHRGDVYR